MQLKLLYTLCTIAGAMSAQDINGVSLGGTATSPSIINNSKKAVVGWTITRTDADGNFLPAHRIVLAEELAKSDNPGIQPGETRTLPPQNIIKTGRPDIAASVQLDSVLFADGEIAGPDTLAPELGALEGFTHQVQMIQEDYRGSTRLLKLPVPHSVASEVPNIIKAHLGKLIPEDIIPIPCSNDGYCYTIKFYSGDQNQSGTVYGAPPYGVETPSVGGTAVCGMDSPQAGYGIGDNVNATVFCGTVNYYEASYEISKRPDLVPDRILQDVLLTNAFTGATQNRARFHELCKYATLPNRGGQGPFGKAVQEYNYSYGCP